MITSKLISEYNSLRRKFTLNVIKKKKHKVENWASYIFFQMKRMCNSYFA